MYITVDNNTNLQKINIAINRNYDDTGMTNCTNKGHITITNNKLDKSLNGDIQVADFDADLYSNCVNEGNIIIKDNSDKYSINQAMNINGDNGATNTGTVTVNGVEDQVNNAG